MRYSYLVPPTPTADLDVVDDDPAAWARAAGYRDGRARADRELQDAVAAARASGADGETVLDAIGRAEGVGRSMVATLHAVLRLRH